MADSGFVLEVHHGGYFVGLPKLYLSGKVDFIRNVDSDLMSYFEVLDLVKGYCEEEEDSESDKDGSECRKRSVNLSDIEYFANGDKIVDCTALVSKESAIRNLEVGDGSGGSGTGQRTVDNIVIDVDEVENDDLNTPMQSLDGNHTIEFTEFF
ncbi:hypothetical protein RHMOL_Rhmol05G0118800 [Rhododendron molle]|uniref:Uncharacterized protein n=1 Tax=Rhododendron molle TaxID=49168 RepID=A0ACC0NNZ3_RHOML|nr:hypothetical protein RHMOL_Rhmol05G0118800 [Rhododendron molle]